MTVSAAVTPDTTPPDAWCRDQGPQYYGWFGVAPGSSADGGVANDLWWDAKGNATPAQMQVYTGNGQDNQRFTLLSSPGEPGGLPYAYSTGVAGC